VLDQGRRPLMAEVALRPVDDADLDPVRPMFAGARE
jgi:hypothetical protein